MDSLFFILFLLSPVLLIVGLLKPDLFKRFPIKDLNRKKITGLSLLLAMTSFIGFAVTIDTPAPIKTEAIQGITEDVVVTPDESVGIVEKDTITPTEKPVATATETQTNLVKVTKVIDGDTIEIESGERVRYIGIDTPERGDCYSNEATNKNSNLVFGKMVRLEKDVSEADRYGRLLRYIWIGNELINETLVRDGFAQSSTYPPDVKYQGRFVAAQRVAVNGNLGLWGAVCDSVQVTQPSSDGTTSGDCMYSCSGPDRDCADFSTHAQAQAFFNCCAFTVNNDPMRLDSVGVGNGIACESLP